MQKRVTYSWDTEWVENQVGPLETDRLPSEVIDNCFVYVRLGSNFGDDQDDLDLDLWMDYSLELCKTDVRPMIVDIKLKTRTRRSVHHNILAHEWRDLCEIGYIKCRIRVPINITCDITWTVPEDPVPEDPVPVLPAGSFLMNSSLSDVTIVIGKEELPAHQLILRGYSSVLSQMLSSPMKEAETRRIIIEDIDVDTMKTVLTFLYKGKSDLLLNIPVACKVLAAAHKYDIPHLQDVCVDNLCKLVNVKDAVEFLELAYLYEVDKLKEVCWKFIVKNKASIMSTQQFKDLCVANDRVLDRSIREFIGGCPTTV